MKADKKNDNLVDGALTKKELQTLNTKLNIAVTKPLRTGNSIHICISIAPPTFFSFVYIFVSYPPIMKQVWT
jgi:hypothetical protein